MKLTDFLNDVGRPVAYYPSLRKLTGGTNATILLCQFIYWRGKEADPNGWLEKTSEEIEVETGLSYDEQKTARRQLRDAEILEEHYARLDHQMRFRLNLDKINEKWAMLQPHVPESGNPMFGKVESPFSLNSNTETTTKNTAFQRGEQERPDKIEALLKMEKDSIGAKKMYKVDALLSRWSVAFLMKTTSKDWKRFAEYAVEMQIKEGWDPEIFIEWVMKQDGYPTYWSQKRMEENYPKAFIQVKATSPIKEYEPLDESEFVPAPTRKQ